MAEMHRARTRTETRTAEGLEVRTEHTWSRAAPEHSQYLVPAITELLGAAQDRTLIDLGCGSGSLTAELAGRGFITFGLDVAGSGVRRAMAAHPKLAFSEHDLGRPLPYDVHEQFDVVLCADVIEHLLLPRELFMRAREALSPGGIVIITTPYHGWLKNVALAVSGRMDQHWNVGQDGGRVKFFSKATLVAMAEECGFELVSFGRVRGRIPALATSMIAQFRKASS